MLKRLLLSGAALTALATFATAQSSPPPADATPPPAATAPASPSATVDPSVKADPKLYTNLQGADVLGENDQSIGSVADLLIAPSGELRALVIAHGGIVGIGQTYRNYEVSALPEVNDGKVKIGALNTAALEGIPEYNYPEAETGRASTESAPAAGNEPKSAPADASASAAPGSQLWPASYIVGATITNAADKPSISDLRVEGNKVAAALIDKGSLGLGNKVQEVAFEDLEISGSPAEPQIALKAGAPGMASDPAAQSSSAPAGAPAPAAP